MEKIEICLTPATVHRGLVTSILVGSFLILINQGPAITAGDLPSLWQVALTYTVPFLVSVISSCLAAPCGSATARGRGNV